jgi:hypothetical protein
MMMLYSVSKICDEMKLMDDETSRSRREQHSRVSQNDSRPLWFKPPGSPEQEEHERAFFFFPPTPS